MRRQGMTVLGLVLLLSLSIQGAVPSVLPQIDLTVTPENPTSSDSLSLMLSGDWPDSCVPEDFDLQVLSGNSIWIDLLLPGWDTKGNCDPLFCLQMITPWTLTKNIEPLSPGTYDVFLRAIACQETGEYVQIGTITVEPSDSFSSGRFSPGDRVVLLQDNPPVGTGLKIGQAGTVVCCDPNDGSGDILVSWDLWANGKIDPFSCPAIVPPLYPTNSALWLDPSQILIGRQFSQCGTLRKGLEGCIYFESDDGHDYNVISSTDLYLTLDGKGTFQFDDHVRLRGLLNTTPPASSEIRLCSQLEGDIYHPIISLCPQGGSDCCGGAYATGDRVVLLTDNPIGPGGLPAVGLPAGTLGTVVCCDSSNSTYPIVVSWDKWTYGGSDAPCAMISSLSSDSFWQMACGQIAPAEDEEPGSEPNEIVINIGDYPLVLTQSVLNPSTYAGCANLQLELSFQAQIYAQVVPETGVSGNWTATLSPDILGPGTVTTQLCVQVVDFDASSLPPGTTQVATITIYGSPVP